MARLVAIGNFFGAHAPFQDLFKEVVVMSLGKYATFELKDDDVVLFGGGADISPSIYNQVPSRHTGARAELSDRDEVEVYMFNAAKKKNLPMLGICRGAQLVCALSGGSLIQHVSNHAGPNHKIATNEGTVIDVCSVHHQMMNPFSTKHELIAWAHRRLSPHYIVANELEVEMKVEPEVVYFPETKALGIQYHPEFMHPDDQGVIYARELVAKYLLKE